RAHPSRHSRSSSPPRPAPPRATKSRPADPQRPPSVSTRSSPSRAATKLAVASSHQALRRVEPLPVPATSSKLEPPTTLTADERDQLTWDQLKGILEAKYYPRHFLERMEREFYDLLQGDRSVEEYEREFARKSTIARHLVDTDDKKASRFRNGLTRDHRVLVASHGYLTYAETVERAQQIEASQLLDTPAQPLAQVAPLARQPAAIQPALPAPPQQAQHRNKRKWRGRDDRRNRRPGAPAQAAPPVPQPPTICATCQRVHRG
ncbi:Unknown protein, partial [Striga hermonthica]